MDSRKYNKLDPSLHLLSDYMSLKGDKRKKVNEQLKEVLESPIGLLPAMKEVDEDFKNMFQQLHYSGSYFENLRISDANEFDLNLELRSQKGSQRFFQFLYTKDYPGYVHLKYLSGDTIKKWVNENGYVMQKKVLSWLQGVVDRALRKMSDGPWYKIRPRMSGPAVTLCVEYDCGEIFTVDMVPVFVLDSSEWPGPPVRQPITSGSNSEQWCVVPKPNDFIDQHGNTGTVWRISFYNQEKSFLNNKNHLKNALKLMKFLRDEERWDWLKSYFLKTVCLWSVMERDEHFWNSGIGVVFMDMLRTLRDYLKDRQSIPFFWDENLNLLSSVNMTEIEKIGNRLERIIKKIDRSIEINNPKYIETLFPTFASVQRFSSSEESLHAENGHLRNAVETTQEVGETTQEETAADWRPIAIGVGALVIGVGAFALGAFLNNMENRDQRDQIDRRSNRDQRDQRDRRNDGDHRHQRDH